MIQSLPPRKPTKCLKSSDDGQSTIFGSRILCADGLTLKHPPHRRGLRPPQRAPTVRRSDVDFARPAKSWGLADHPFRSGVKRMVRTLSAGSTTQSAHDHEI